MARVRAEYRTGAREGVTGVLRGERRFLTAAEIAQALHDRGDKISLSTVYRTLDHLQAKGAITVRTGAEGGEAGYMYCADEPARHHHHAICRVCGRVEDVDCTAVDNFAETLRTTSGFQLDGHAMEFFGRCRQCNA